MQNPDLTPFASSPFCLSIGKESLAKMQALQQALSAQYDNDRNWCFLVFAEFYEPSGNIRTDLAESFSSVAPAVEFCYLTGDAYLQQVLRVNPQLVWWWVILGKRLNTTTGEQAFVGSFRRQRVLRDRPFGGAMAAEKIAQTLLESPYQFQAWLQQYRMLEPHRLIGQSLSSGLLCQFLLDYSAGNNEKEIYAVADDLSGTSTAWLPTWLAVFSSKVNLIQGRERSTQDILKEVQNCLAACISAYQPQLQR